MSKSILIIDTPKTCDDCPFLNYTNGVGLTICENKDRMIPDEGKPSWCPLKPMPEKKTTKNPIWADRSFDDYDKGYNACLEEIER